MAPSLQRQHGSARLWAIVRAGCLALIFSLLGLFVAGVPLRAQQLSTLVTAADPAIFPGLPSAMAAVYTSRLALVEAEALQGLDLSLSFYAFYLLAFETGLALVCAAGGLFIFWRRTEDWLTLWVSLLLVLLGTTAVSPEVSTLSAAWVGWEWFSTGVGLLGMVSFLHILYLAPNGRFVPRWTLRLAAGFTGGTLGLCLAISLWNWRVITILVSITVTLMAWLILCSVGIGSQVFRYRHVSGPLERQQIKWVAVGLAAVTLGILVNGMLLTASSQASGLARLLHNFVRTPLVFLCLLALPICLAFSILRYRLWDIDVIVRRTLIYSVLSAVLVLAYFGSVLVLQNVFRALTGQGQSSLVAVLSTLAIAALFGPLRVLVQRAIDRRFYRQKYDAARTLAGFAASARDETDLDHLSAQLVGVVEETMQPASVGLWLRGRKR